MGRTRLTRGDVLALKMLLVVTVVDLAIFLAWVENAPHPPLWALYVWAAGLGMSTNWTA